MTLPLALGATHREWFLHPFGVKELITNTLL